MKILVLAPQPFFQERGTPIAVRAMATFLGQAGAEVDLLTYHEGTDVPIPRVRIHRIAAPRWVRDVPPGFSLRKLVCDALLWVRARAMLRATRYDYVHAVEESAFLAMLFRRRYGVPYVYDMDSSLAEQMADSCILFRMMRPLMPSKIARARPRSPACA